MLVRICSGIFWATIAFTFILPNMPPIQTSYIDPTWVQLIEGFFILICAYVFGYAIIPKENE